MTLKFKTIAPGSMIVSKRYNMFKRLWYKIRKKELPYNCITLFTETTSILDIYNSKSSDILLTLKKNYSKEELSLLHSLIEDYSQERYIATIDFCKNYKEIHDLSIILNTVRSYSFNVKMEEDFVVSNTAIRRKYYVSKLAEEKDWDICIY